METRKYVGRNPVSRHALKIRYRWGNRISIISLRMKLDIPSLPGAFFEIDSIMVDRISCMVILPGMVTVKIFWSSFYVGQIYYRLWGEKLVDQDLGFSPGA